jgi:glutamine amidotransferase
MTSVAIINYNGGNTASVAHAVRRAGGVPLITEDPAQLSTADRVIFPGVGEASSTMRYLRERGLDDVILSLKQPVLGICLGMQLFCEHSEEGDARGLGIYASRVKKIPADSVKVPHVGWNTVESAHTVHDQCSFQSTKDRAYFYYVHSFAATVGPHTVATTTHGIQFSAIMKRDNFIGVQFHPERSGALGGALIRTFIEKGTL